MISMFPKAKKEISSLNFKIGLRFLQKDLQLIIDRNKCQGCGICSAVCPKEAIFSGPKTKGKSDSAHTIMDDNIILDVSDPNKCVYCGTCTVFCPFDAIKLMHDGREVPISELNIVKGNAVPKLEGETKIMRKTKKPAKIYLEGKVIIKNINNSDPHTFKTEYINNCPGECHKCVDICPNEALSINPAEEAMKFGIPIKLDESRCIACGSCVMACPSDRITLARTKIHYSGSYNADFMAKIANKLGVPLKNE
jgi:ferredoxin